MRIPPSSRPVRSPRLSRLSGPPPALPPALDRLAETWATATPRARLAVGVAATLLAVLLALLRAGGAPAAGALVTTRSLPAGATVAVGDLAVVEVPPALLPVGALAPGDAETLVGRTVVGPLAAGAIVTDVVLTDGGVAALAGGAGRVVVAVPVEVVPALPSLPTGTRVDLLATSLDGTGTTAAAGAQVVGADGAVVWVSVRRDEAAGVAAATTLGDLTVAVLGRPDG
ncbi:MAG: SAF domain-containing protein [Actinomycetes bacterium]